MENTINPHTLVEILNKRCLGFMKDEIGLDATECRFHPENVQKLELNYITVIISAAGNIKMHFAFSFEEALIKKIFDIYCKDIEIEEDERHQYIEETAAEIVNVIIGNSTADFRNEGTVITLSPPIVITEAKTVFRERNASFYTASLTFAEGRLNIHCIVPWELFKPNLDYAENGAR